MITNTNSFKYDIFSNNNEAEKFVGKHNNRFKSVNDPDYDDLMYEGSNHLVLVCNWTEQKDEFSSNIKEVSFEDFNREITDTCISFRGFISSVDIPKDLTIKLHACRKCGNMKLSSADVKLDDFPHSKFQTFCKDCSNVEEVGRYTVRASSRSDVVRPKLYEFYVQSQRIVVSHPDSMKKVVVYIHSNKPMFKKEDVGKLYTFVGVLRGANAQMYEIYDSRLSDLLSEDKKKNKNMSYLMIAPHVEEVKQDTSTEVVVDDTTNVENNREDVSPAWRREVLKRDKHCVICGGEKHLEAHHIFGYKGYPELRDNVDNGITLCQFCHGNYHSQYGVKNPNPVTFVNFIKGFR